MDVADPVAVHVFKAPEELVNRQLQEINRWVKSATLHVPDPATGKRTV